MERFLEGRIALITGGFSGIGKAIALALAERGATIAIGARSDPSDEVIEELQQVATRLFYQRLDVSSLNSVNDFIDELASAQGYADILVNNAGITAHELVSVHAEKSWLDVIDVNLSGPFRMIRACLPTMIKQRWGRIINIGSTAATTAVADHAAYCASKSGLLGLSRAVALEGAPHGVSSVVISPTWVQTEMFNSSMAIQARNNGRSVDEEIAELMNAQPQQRLVQPQELGALAAFLCRDEALGITMEDIQLNAGALW